MAAIPEDSDLDLAFDLQMQEAMNASLALHSAASSSNDAVLTLQDDDDDDYDYYDLDGNDDDDVSDLALALLLEDIEAEERGKIDGEMRKLTEDLDRRIHDQKLAADIFNIPDDEWRNNGDHFHRPYGTDSSSSSSSSSECFRVYFKGLVSEERVRDRKVIAAGIGAAVCDSRDNLIVKVKKPLESEALVGGASDQVLSSQGADLYALIKGLEAALSFDLKRLTFFCDDYIIYQYVLGRLPRPRQSKIAESIDQVAILRSKFTYCNPSLVARNDIKLAFKLAKEVIITQVTWSAGKSLKETCVICYEDNDVDQMFSVDGCLHRYCLSCMKQHVEVKLLNGMGAKCPHEGCKSEVNIDSCEKFLDPKLIQVMSQRSKESSIPVTEKVYCPYPKCSALMSKSEVLEYTKTVDFTAEQSGVRKCIKCLKRFCIKCKVPWHDGRTCRDYEKNPSAEDAKLKSLAKNKLWRQCVKCNHMVELAEGCYHITCRCGHEFCYTCGAKWKNKKARCSCPRWDERNIIRDQ